MDAGAEVVAYALDETTMPALYLHIPFCRRACTYCDFHFSTAQRGRGEMVAAIAREIELRAGEMPPGPWTSVYLGGGTPSLLSQKQVSDLLDAARSARPIAPDAEITLEANPDDLTPAVVAALADTEVNRLSIGVQSFREEDLRFMGRAHDAAQATACLAAAQAAGFDELTIDLIYGTPGLTDDAWRQNLAIATGFGVPHISAYALTVEPGTALAHDIAKGRVAALDEEQAARQMELLVDALAAAGYEHYEVSNFALPGRRARHNSGYWRGEAYLGVGPSAHSFDGGRVRSWNVRNNARYVRAIAAGELPIERETLSDRDRYNELVLTRLRTDWGVDLAEVEALGFSDSFLAEVAKSVAAGLVRRAGDRFRLTRAGRMRADGVSEALFVV